MVGVVFSDEKILVAEISNNNNKTLPEIKKLAQLDLNNYELINLAIFNSDKIANFINNFISVNKLNKQPVIFCLDGSKLNEFYEKPECKDKLNCDCQNCKLYNTSYTNFNGTSYYCQISYSILFQYKLLALNLGLNLISIITDIIAANELLNHETGEKEASRSKLKKKLVKKQEQYALKQLIGTSFVLNKK